MASGASGGRSCAGPWTVTTSRSSAVNDITDAATLAHLLAFDSTYGPSPHRGRHTDDSIVVDGKPIAVSAPARPGEIDWAELGVDVVIESTGKFRTRDDAALHLKGGATKVLISARARASTLTIVLGVNDATYDPQRHDVDLQRLLHHELRGADGEGAERCVRLRARVHDHGARVHRRPDAARRPALGPSPGPRRRGQHHPHDHGRGARDRLVIPELAGQLDGVALRVPVEDGSLTDLAVVLDREATADDVNAAFAAAAYGPLAGILKYSTDPIVSRDVIGDTASCVFDSPLTQASGTLVKVFGWYDNEWGYTCRLADLAALVGARL